MSPACKYDRRPRLSMMVARSFGNNAHLPEFERRIGFRSGTLRADVLRDELDGDLLAGILLCHGGDVKGESLAWPRDFAAGAERRKSSNAGAELVGRRTRGLDEDADRHRLRGRLDVGYLKDLPFVFIGSGFRLQRNAQRLPSDCRRPAG